MLTENEMRKAEQVLVEHLLSVVWGRPINLENEAGQKLLNAVFGKSEETNNNE